MSAVAMRQTSNRGRWIALGMGIAFASYLAISFKWPPATESQDVAPSRPVVAEGGTGKRGPKIPPPLSGNDSSVAAIGRHLVLTGTQVALDPRDNLAFIGVDPKNPQTYAVNSLLVNGTRVQEIARDYVLLERNGQVAKLEIGGAWAEIPASVKRLTAITAPLDAPAAIPDPPEHALTDGLSISPAFDANGMLTSYRLRPGRFGRVFARWGLESGDQLVAIENAPLTNVDTTAQMLEMVGRGESLSATVLRHGVPVQVVLDGRVIAEERSRAQAAPDSSMAIPAS